MSHAKKQYRQVSNDNSKAGFTIIETLLVLAIAGFILMIVMMAIPTLLRNSKNGQRKQDVASILQAVSRYELNHSGTFPPNCASSAPPCFLSYAKLSHYDPANVIVEVNGALNGAVAGVTDGDQVIVRHYYKCAAGGGASDQGAGYRDVVALYAVETADGTASQCQQL